MKRILRFLSVTVTAILCMGIMAQAAPYKIEPIKMSVDIPDGWIVITQDGELPESQLKVLGIDTKDLVENLKKKNIFLNAVSPAPLSEITITMRDDQNSSTIFDFNRYSNEELIKIANEMITGGEKTVKYSNPQVASHPQGKFVTFSLEKKQGDKTVYGIQNYTVINGQAVSISLISYDGPVSSRQAEQLNGVLSSVKFDEVKPIPSGITIWIVLAIVGALLIIATVVIFIISKKNRRNSRRGKFVTRV